MRGFYNSVADAMGSNGDAVCEVLTGKPFLTGKDKILAVSKHRSLTSPFVIGLIENWATLFCFCTR